MAQVELARDPETGKRNRRIYYARTRREVADKLLAAVEAQHHGQLPSTRAGTVGQYLAAWLEARAARWEECDEVPEASPRDPRLAVDRPQPRRHKGFVGQHPRTGESAFLLPQEAPDRGWDEAHLWTEAEGSWDRCPVGHWVVRGVMGEFYPHHPDSFTRTYEPVEAEQETPSRFR